MNAWMHSVSAPIKVVIVHTLMYRFFCLICHFPLFRTQKVTRAITPNNRRCPKLKIASIIRESESPKLLKRRNEVMAAVKRITKKGLGFKNVSIV
jgi:hypothetical protein